MDPSLFANGGAASPPIDQGGDNGAALVLRPPLQFPDNAPNWLRDSIKVLTHQDLGLHYRSLVETLLRIEERFGFDDNPRLGVSTEGRPKELGKWVNAARGTRSKKPYDAEIKDVDDYARRWGSWWDSLQPAWRQRGTEGNWKVYPAYEPAWEWGSLSSYGTNGCLSLVASLYFWGMAKEDATTWGKWDWAVQDVLWMLEGVEASLPVRKGKGRSRK
ncbi:hypothetical protein DFH06DRAFT_1018521 [Mycena polygramma]|nr:hypothetical protein DFH06DRAFT_1018521 [Mycena polygramma]